MGEPIMTTRVICNVHARPLYFELSVNSLLYSLEGQDVPVTIVIQDPDNKTLRLAERYMEYPNVDVLYVKENTCFSGVTIALKWHKPDTMVLHQDDLVIPAKFRQVCPNWVMEWKEWLLGYDLVTMKIGTNNLPYKCEWLFDKVGAPVKLTKDWCCYDTSIGLPLLLCQTCMMRTSFYWQCWNDGPKAAIDSMMLQKSKRIAVLNITCQHMSWDNEMNGYLDRQEWAKGFNLGIEEVEVKSLNTNETRSIRLEP